jgi:hypothetical protein
MVIDGVSPSASEELIFCQNLFGGNVDCRGGDPLTDHHHPQS